MLTQTSTDPTNNVSKTVTHTYTYDAQGNVLTEFRNGANGMERFNLTHTYDALNRLTGTTGDQGYKAHTYTYDSLGNMTYELVHNKGTEYWYNALNQQIKKKVDNKDTYVYNYDNRGNLVEGIYQKNQNQGSTVEAYEYDETNRMVAGMNDIGETSIYRYNGLGYLIGQTMLVKKNAYGYVNVNDITGLYSFEDFTEQYYDEIETQIKYSIMAIKQQTYAGFDVACVWVERGTP